MYVLTFDIMFMIVSHAKKMLPLSTIIPFCSVILIRQSITCRQKNSHISCTSKAKLNNKWQLHYAKFMF
jgi:hypothetical protein